MILLDEPLSNLDAKLREEARAWLRELIVRMQLSALCVTHDQCEALAMSDRILLLNGGMIEQQGTPQEMYSAPQSLFTADFMGSNNRLPARSPRCATARRSSRATAGSCGGRRSRAASGADGTGMIRLERVGLADGPGDNRLAAELTTSMYLGDKWEHLFRSATERARLRRPAAGGGPALAGDAARRVVGLLTGQAGPGR